MLLFHTLSEGPSSKPKELGPLQNLHPLKIRYVKAVTESGDMQNKRQHPEYGRVRRAREKKKGEEVGRRVSRSAGVVHSLGLDWQTHGKDLQTTYAYTYFTQIVYSQ